VGNINHIPDFNGVGLFSKQANMTNTVALLPGYLGGIVAQRKDMRGQRARLYYFVPAGVIAVF